MAKYNIYCDESCHLEHDGINVMVLGSVWCPQDKIKEINRRICDIKKRNNISQSAEMKWTKISPSKNDLYLELLNYFFDDDDLHFRALVIPDKTKLNHERYHQDHDIWYYKMLFAMLKVIIHPSDNYEIYIDFKDKKSHRSAEKLREVCSNSMYDFSGRIIRRLQPIRSDEVQIMQLVDVLTGAIGYQNRVFPAGFIKSSAKQEVIELIMHRSGYSLKKNTLLREDKCNLFIWDARTTNGQ